MVKSLKQRYDRFYLVLELITKAIDNTRKPGEPRAVRPGVGLRLELPIDAIQCWFSSGIRFSIPGLTAPGSPRFLGALHVTSS